MLYFISVGPKMSQLILYDVFWHMDCPYVATLRTNKKPQNHYLNFFMRLLYDLYHIVDIRMLVYYLI